MKKLSAILVALILVAATAVTAFAAGINSNEQAVLDELASGSGATAVSASYVNQAENYFNTIDMTAEESSQIIASIKSGKAVITSAGVASIDDLTLAQKQEVFADGQAAVGVLGMTMSYDQPTKVVSIVAPDGTVALSATVGKAPTGGTSGSGSTSTVTDTNAIKTTGASLNYLGFAVVGGVAVVLMAGGALYLVKTKKERA